MTTITTTTTTTTTTASTTRATTTTTTTNATCTTAKCAIIQVSEHVLVQVSSAVGGVGGMCHCGDISYGVLSM